MIRETYLHSGDQILAYIRDVLNIRDELSLTEAEFAALGATMLTLRSQKHVEITQQRGVELAAMAPSVPSRPRPA